MIYLKEILSVFAVSVVAVRWVGRNKSCLEQGAQACFISHSAINIKSSLHTLSV